MTSGGTFSNNGLTKIKLQIVEVLTINIGDFKEEPEPVIDCKLCASEYYFKRVMRLDSWTDIYIEVWELKNR